MTSWGSNSNSGSKLVSWFATLGRKKGKRLNQSTSALNAFSLNAKQNTIKGFKSASDLLDHSVSSNPDYVSGDQTKRNSTAIALKNKTLSRNSVSSSVGNSVAGKDHSDFSDKKRSLVSLTLDRKILRKKRSTTWYHPPDWNPSSFSRLDSTVDQSSVSLSETALRDTDCDKNLKTEITRAHQLSLGCKKFNLEPKKGIEFLVQQGFLQETPHNVALFLYKGEGLGKTAIGEYLGEKHPFHEEVLREFVNLHDFSNLILVQALRQFLWSFRLPGEAQKIDRMMESFARRYCSQNPDIFSHTDTCYVLSFAVIMLNTNLHNPNVKDKLKVEQFVLMNRGIDSGNDLPEEMLQSLYESIKAEPFTIPEDDGNDLLLTFFNPVREGWLTKRGGRYKSWKRRWFILNDSCLYYFEHTTDKEPLGIIPLENIQVREVSDRSLSNCFELYSEDSNNFLKACKTDSHGKVTKGRHLVYRMSACTPQEKDDWIDCLRRNTSHNPLAAAVAARKSRLQKTNY